MFQSPLGPKLDDEKSHILDAEKSFHFEIVQSPLLMRFHTAHPSVSIEIPMCEYLGYFDRIFWTPSGNQA